LPPKPQVQWHPPPEQRVHGRRVVNPDQFAPWLSGEAGAQVLKPAPNNYLRRWPVSKLVNSSKADADDATLIEPVEVASV
jgi:putative SOS response-associated peptidase YedK